MRSSHKLDAREDDTCRQSNLDCATACVRKMDLEMGDGLVIMLQRNVIPFVSLQFPAKVPVFLGCAISQLVVKHLTSLGRGQGNGGVEYGGLARRHLQDDRVPKPGFE
jgi:hypothetical protein